MLNKDKLYIRLFRYLFLLLLLFITLMPVYIIVSNSFRPTLQIKEMPPKLFFQPTAKHFLRLIEYDNFINYFKNSIIISVAVTVLTISFGVMAAYGLKICKSRIGERLSNLMLLGKLVPTVTILIPFFIMMNRIHLTGTYLGPIVSHSAMTMPFVVWLMVGFVRDIPQEIIESACVEGSSRMQTLWKIIFPMLTPAIASAIVLEMRYSWNELMFSLQLTNIKTYPLTVGIARYVGAISVDWGKSSIAATISMIPIIIIGFVMQRYLVSGMTAGAVKS